MPSDFMMTPEELRLRTRKRRRLFLILGIGLALGLIIFFAARPTGRAIKSWQARRHAEKAFAYLDQEKWEEAKNSAVSAYQLSRNEPQAIRAIARLLSRTRQAEALEFWKQFRADNKMSADDLRDEASIALLAGITPRAETAMIELLALPQPEPRDHLLAAQLAAQKGSAAEATAAIDQVLAHPKTDERERLQAAILLLGGRAQRRNPPASLVRDREDRPGPDRPRPRRPRPPRAARHLLADSPQ